MNKIKWMAVSAALFCTSWMAQPSVSWSFGKKEMSVEEHVKELRDKLVLTTDQEAQIREILQDKKRKKEEVKQDAHQKIRNVLTEQQRSKFNDILRKAED